MAGPSTPTQSPGGNGTIDVKPSDLWSVSGRVATQQDFLIRGANKLLEELREYPDAGGAGTEAQQFAQAYKKIGDRWLEVWGKSVLSVGGVAVGFTETANAYTQADAAANPKPGKTAEQRPRPAVVDKAPKFDSIPDIKWGDDDGGDDIMRGAMEAIPEIVRDVLQPLCKHVFRVGRVADVHPFPQQHYLNSLCHSWMNVSITASLGADQLTQAVGTITNHHQADWEAAMRTFCSALWGGTAWGRQQSGYQWGQTANSGPGTPRVPTGSEPVLAVLKDTADNIATILREYAEAAVDLNRDVEDEIHRAMLQAAKEIIEDLAKPKGPKSLLGTVTSAIGKGAGLILSFDVKTVLNINTAKLNRIVNTYTGILGGLTTRMEALKGPLDEAHRSAPKFEAGVARAHGFGARALDEFKHEQRWTEAGATGNHAFDLASNEYLGGGHTLDKHVGKTDEQLAQRLRDQAQDHSNWPEQRRPTIGGSSSFKDMASAQRLTEHNLRAKQSEIDAWLATNPPEGKTEAFTSPAPNGEASGKYVGKQPTPDPNDPSKNIPGTGYRDHGLDAKAVDVKNVKTILKYDSRLDPPYIIYTSMPAP
ncbi:RNase A-like domain-containing protein [Streptomyces sp. NBC_00259]|uniref:RNase A-like domain-containing protein n=1 Tax=Streptomyces sp. NBC_00259 TaxID=2903643 RepID=UPI002E2E76AD|nr:RNase A-like domain-containing protein [Streptomyces sp. NBC_00259]